MLKARREIQVALLFYFVDGVESDKGIGIFCVFLTALEKLYHFGIIADMVIK